MSEFLVFTGEPVPNQFGFTVDPSGLVLPKLVNMTMGLARRAALIGFVILSRRGNQVYGSTAVDLTAHPGLYPVPNYRIFEQRGKTLLRCQLNHIHLLQSGAPGIPRLADRKVIFECL